MSERNVIQRTFDEFARNAGFEKKSGTWYRFGAEVVAVLNLQKSQYSPRYYMNQGFSLRALAVERYPGWNRCHIQARVDGLLPEAQQRLGELLDLEYEIVEDIRGSELQSTLDNDLLPLILRAETIDGLRHLLAEGTFRRAGIRGPAQLLLTQSGA